MSIIEQAARRLDALNRAGIDVPWEAAGVEARDAVAQLARGGGLRDPWDPRVDNRERREAGAGAGTDVAEASSALLPPVAPLDLAHLAASGLLVPGLEDSALGTDFRRAKRALLEQVRPALAARPGSGAVVVVTSAVDGEGRTTCAINLALSMAMEVDTSVVLVEADVRRPQVLARLGLPAGAGLSELLADPQLPLARAIVPTSLPGLSVLAAGEPDARAHERLAGPGMRSLMTQLVGHRPDRIVVVDAPALLRSPDAGALAALATQVVVVVAAQRTPRAQVRQAFAMLDGALPVVALLNHLPAGTGTAGVGGGQRTSRGAGAGGGAGTGAGAGSGAGAGTVPRGAAQTSAP
jgi:protein-tyrosine kinase